jgi:hypothetical protein
MVIQKIDGELYFSNIFVCEEFDSMATEARMGGTAYDEALLQFVFQMESCDEAVQSFEGFAVCPICGAHAKGNQMIHKNPEDMIQ